MSQVKASVSIVVLIGSSPGKGKDLFIFLSTCSLLVFFLPLSFDGLPNLFFAFWCLFCTLVNL